MVWVEINFASDGFHITLFGGENFTLFHLGLDTNDRVFGGILFNLGWGIRW